jgi:protease-4
VRVGGRNPLPSATALRRVAESPDVRGLWLKVERANLGGGIATLLEAGEALGALRAAGKLVVAEFDHVGNPEMVLAAACDRAWLRPGAQVWSVGLGSTLRFFGDALSRHGAGFDVLAVGEFKSFGETFSRSWASPENREAVGTLLEDLQGSLVQFAAGASGLSEAAVRAAFEEAPLTAETAVERGLFDGALYPDQVAEELKGLVGGEPRVVPFPAWWKAVGRARRLGRWMAGRPQIAVVGLQGAVVDGQGQPAIASIPAGPVVGLLDSYLDNEAVRGVVLRVSSPGGSAAASDLMWRSVQRLAAKKPVVASFGDVCASGGFYLTASATEIVCHPATITGSIGVIAGKPVLRPALERYGVHSEDVLAAPQADVFAETAFSGGSRARLRAGLEDTYRTFVDRVATGRRRPAEQIEPLARGRVWSGSRAHALGLVDRLGGVELAVERAAALAGVSEPCTTEILVRPSGGWLTRLARGMAQAAVPELRLLDRVPLTARLLMDSPAEALALLPFEIDLR